MFKIFIIEDDQGLVTLLQDYLHKFGYETQAVQDFEAVRTEFEQYAPHLVLLDVNLPKFDGYYWCRQIRGISTCPILFISAREGKMDQVMALENGADDYITKPFDYEIALAKIKSHLRRAYGSYAAGGNERSLNVSGLLLDVDRLLLSRDGARIELSHTEAKILNELMQKAGTVVTRDRLLEKIWDEQAFVDDNTLNVYVTRVRKKLAVLEIQDGLQTVRGQGYRLSGDWGEHSEAVFTGTDAVNCSVSVAAADHYAGIPAGRRKHSGGEPVRDAAEHLPAAGLSGFPLYYQPFLL